MKYEVDSYQRVFTKVLNFVSYKPRTEAEIVSRLQTYLSVEKITESEKQTISEKIIAALKRDGYINNKLVLEQYLSGFNLSKKPKSFKKFSITLRRKGFSADEVAGLSLEVSPEKEFSSALEDANRKLKKLKNSSKSISDNKKLGWEIKSKLSSYLYSKGYSHDAIKAVFDTLQPLQ